MATFLTYDDSNTKASVMEVVTNLSPTKTPFLSSLAKVQVNNTRFYWPTDSLSDAVENAEVEGSAFSYGTLTGATQISNYTQIFQKTYVVSSSEQAVKSYGISDNKAYQLMKKTKEVSRDIELALLCGTLVAGNSSTARKLAGAIQFTTTNSTTVTSGTLLTETIFMGLIQNANTAGGEPDTVYVPPVLKRAISAFVGNSTRNSIMVASSAQTLSAAVDRYRSDFGDVTVVNSLYMPHAANGDTILVLQNDLWKLGVLEALHDLPQAEVAQTVNGTAGVLRGELTLISMAQNSGSRGLGFNN